jgi:hypothetical protein
VDFVAKEDGFDGKYVVVDENSIEVALQVTKQDFNV